jgi:hypothetical protein
MASRYVVEHLNHLGIVAEVCPEIGVAAWPDQHEPGDCQCFEGIDLHHTLLPEVGRWTEVLRLNDLHRLVLRLLGPPYEHCYLVFQQTPEGDGPSI